MYNPAPMKNSNYDLVIFDCDGVLVNSEPLANQVYIGILEEHGHQVNSDEYLQEFSGASISQRLAVTTKKLNWTPPSNFTDLFQERLALLSRQELKPVPGIHELIESLTVPICIGSNGTRSEILLRLRIAKLTDYFENVIFSGYEVPNPKPAPDVFLAAAQSFNVPPSRCIVIEDSIPGVTAGVRAGMRVYGHAAFTPVEDLRKAGAIPFANMMELKSMLVQ
jgi:HAD superfamily hydrolase (TIGR01509 family)